MIDRLFFTIFLHGVFFFISFGAFYHQIIRGGYYLQKAENNYIRLLPLPAERGTIYDARGDVLVRDFPEYEVSIIPAEVKDKDEVFTTIARITQTSFDTVLETYRKHLLYPFAYTPVVRNIPKKDALRIEELSLKGVFVSTRWRRHSFVPYALSQVVGYVKEMQQGASKLKKYGFTPDTPLGYTGIEEYYDEYLRGEPGGVQIEVDSRGRVMNLLGKKLPQKGRDVYLTIDKQMQESAYAALQGRIGALIFMDVQTGEILSMVSSPSYNSNDFDEGKNVRSVFADPRKPLLNRAIQGEYAPGSIFKIVTAAAALIDKKISPYMTHECLGHYNLGSAVSRCWTTHGVVNLMDALKVSCNVYFWSLSLNLTKDPIIKWARLFGYGKAVGIDLPYERKGFVPSRVWKQMALHEDWFAGDTMNLSIGQGFLMVTPIQALQMITAVARNGVLVTPFLVKRIDRFETKRPGTEKVPLTEESLTYIKDGLVRVVSAADGTAHFLAPLDLGMAGKTGTAQAPPNPPHGWFVGYFPQKDPQYSMVVFLEHGTSGGEAVKVAYDFLREVKEKGLLKKIENEKP